MRIVHTEASLGWGGQEIRILTESAGMIARGHQVTLLCPPDARIFSEAQKLHVPAVPLPIGRKRLKGVLALYRWLKVNRPEVINTHSSSDSWLAALACSMMKMPPPLVRTRHISAPIPNNPVSRWLYQKASRHIVTTGEQLRRQLIERNAYLPLSITSVPTGIDTRRYSCGDRTTVRKRLGLPMESQIVGIVATLRSWKGHDYLLRAFSTLKRDVTLVIVGDGPRRQAIERQIADLELTSRVFMVGNQDNVVPWLQALDIFVLPSYANEGVPQAIMQAMACCLPVVSTPVGSISEIIEPGVTGMLVPPRNSSALSLAIAQLLEDDNLRQTLGKTARNIAEQKCALSSMLNKMESVFKNAMASK